METNISNIGIAIYRKKDYQKIYEMSSNKSSMNKTWEEWSKKKDRLVKDFEILGIQTVDILVLPNELIEYCKKHNLKINGAARAQFVKEKVDKLLPPTE